MGSDPQPAGGAVTFESAAEHACARIPRFSPGERVGDVRSRMQGRSYDCASHIVVLEGDRFLGVVTIETLLAAPGTTTLAELMDRDPPMVSPGVDQEIAAWRAVRHEESALPVVNGEGRFVGVIPPHRLLAVLLSEHEEDLSRMGGFTRGARIARLASEEPVPGRVRHRLPWLLAGLAGALLGADFVSLFDEQLRRTVVLAFFLPGIVYLADAVGTQTETIVVRGLSLGVSLRRMLARELLVGLAIGLVLGAIAAPLVWLRWDAFDLGLCVGLSIAATCFAATLAGLGVPWLLDRWRFDPALGTAPLSTVIQDLLSIAIYLGIAAALVD
jgi:magnesium transporter